MQVAKAVNIYMAMNKSTITIDSIFRIKEVNKKQAPYQIHKFTRKETNGPSIVFVQISDNVLRQDFFLFISHFYFLFNGENMHSLDNAANFGALPHFPQIVRGVKHQSLAK
jgi:hypothetical protein